MFQHSEALRLPAESDYVGAFRTKLAMFGTVVPVPLARRNKAIQHDDVADGPANGRSIMSRDSDTGKARPAAYYHCKPGKAVAYLPRSANKVGMIESRIPSYAAIRRRAPQYADIHPVRRSYLHLYRRKIHLRHISATTLLRAASWSPILFAGELCQPLQSGSYLDA